MRCDGRIRNNYPINLFRNLVPQVDTPLSPKPRTEHRAVSQLLLIINVQPTLSQWKQEQSISTEWPWQKVQLYPTTQKA